MKFGYGLKRLLSTGLVLWLLITVVFLLSRLLPGTYGAESIYVESSGYSKSSQQQKDKVYQEYLRKTGQTLPLFYGSINSQAAPNHENTGLRTPAKWLEQLSWQYGNPQKAAAFYNAVQNFALLQKKENVTESLSSFYKLQNTLVSDSILFYAKMIARETTTSSVSDAGIILYESAQDMVEAGNDLHYLIPHVQWHGTRNQYHYWFTSLLQGDLGNSYRDSRPVATILWDAVGNTFWLILISLLLSSIIALELSIVMVRKTSINWQRVILPVLYVIDSIPLFVLCLMLLLVFASPDFLQIFPVFGLGFVSDVPDTWFSQLIAIAPYLILPVICLVITNVPYLTNQIYRSLADSMQSNYIKTARAKGLKENVIIRGHALRNALLPVITIFSDYLPALVAGSVVIETIFAIPGIGRLLFNAVLARDFPVILGIVITVAVVKLISHLVADICYAQADPRVHQVVAS